MTAVLGSLVSYGGITFLCSTAETIAIGSVSALICFFGNCVTTVGAKCQVSHSHLHFPGLMYFDKNHNIDDPCCTFVGKMFWLIELSEDFPIFHNIQ